MLDLVVLIHTDLKEHKFTGAGEKFAKPIYLPKGL